MSTATLDALIAALSLEEQVGQLIAGRLWGTAINGETTAHFQTHHIGNVILFAHNFGTPDEARTLTAQIEAVCGRPGLPALICADQEGGRVQRLQPPATSFPSQMALGATNSADYAHRWGVATARELRSLGLNMNFSPVFDVNNNAENPVIGTRAYGESVELVTRLGLAGVAGLHEGGVVATAKHFPGHGDTALDSHYDLPTLPYNLERLRAVELAPFQAAVAAGVPAIITAHIIFPALDPSGLPGTLSRRILTDLLRDEMGFTGVIVSDAMNMHAITTGWGIVEGSVRFIEAGGDLVEPMAEEAEVHAAICAAVRSGRIPAAQIAASVRRIAQLKAWVAAQGPGDPTWLGTPEHHALAASIAQNALTVIRDEAHLLPIQRDTRIVVLETFYQWVFRATAERPTSSPLAEALRSRFPHVSGIVLDGQEPGETDYAAARAAVDAADMVVLGTRATNRFPAQAAFVNTVLSWGKPTIAVALSDPYDALAYPTAPTALATYGADSAMIEALGAFLAGEAPAGGRLPVTL